MLHIEINGDLDRREWQGVKVLAMVMLGEISAEALIAASALPAIVNKIGVDADRPTPPPPAAFVPEPLAVVPPPPVAATVPPPPINPGAIPPSESLMAAAATAAAAAVAAGAELDSSGLPWDARIHAGTRTKKADKTWTAKRGVDPALVAAVTAELRAVMAAPTITPPPPETPASPPLGVTDPAAAFGAGAIVPAPTPTAPVSGGAAETPPAPSVAEVPAPPATPAEGAGAGATPDNIGEFARVMRVVVAKQNAGALSTELTTQIAQQLGLTGVRDLAKRPDLIPAFEALLP